MFTVRVITPPEPIVQWEAAKTHLRLDDDEQRDYIEALIAAATGWIDGPAGWLGRSIGAQTLELADCAFGNDRLPYGPVVSVESVVYRGPAGLDVTMPAQGYRLLLNGSLAPLDAWPALASNPEAVRIRYVAGYPDRIEPPAEPGAPQTRVSTVPAAIRHAVLMLVAHWFVQRETADEAKIEQVPFGVEALLAPFRVWSF